MTPPHAHLLRSVDTSQCILWFLLMLSVAVGGVLAQPSLLDPTFSEDGKVSTHILSFNSWGNDAVLQPDGKIVIVGAGNNDLNFPLGFQASAVRFNADGSLDSTFHGDGRVSTIMEAGKVSEAKAVAIQPDGKIVVTGIYETPDVNDSSGFIIRYNADGSLDTSFDSDGIKLFPSVFNIPYDIAVQPDGKIVVAEHKSGFRIARFNSDGSADLTFNNTGFAVIPNGGSVASEPVRLALRPNGKIVCGGISLQPVIAQLNSNGTPDSTFGNNGVVNGIEAYALTLQTDGKILVAHRNNFFPHNTLQVIERLNEDGSPDTGFGSGGSATVSFINQAGDLARPVDLAVQPDGKIVLGGTIRLSPAGTGFDFALARLNANGSYDNSFGFSGRVTTDIQGQDYGRSVMLQPDGKVVLAGQSDGGFAVARYIPASLSLTCRPDGDFTGDGKSDPAVYQEFGTWRYLDSLTGQQGTVMWGGAPVIAPADYNGDCRTDFAVYDDGQWQIRYSSSPATLFYQWGLAGDTPVPGDYDGDDLADPAVFRSGVWWILGTRDGSLAVQWGLASDKPVPGDYDGDGKEDLAVYRDGTWYLLQSTGGVSIAQFGLATDKPVVGDYDGDNRSDIAVYRPSEGTWYLLRSTEGFMAVRWGISTDRPVPADYDGDGRTDIAVYRTGDWYLLQSTAGYQLKQIGGGPGDFPVQNAYVR